MSEVHLHRPPVLGWRHTPLWGVAFRRCRGPALYRGVSLIRNSPPMAPYGRTMPGALWCSYGGARFLMSKVPQYRGVSLTRTPPLLPKGYRRARYNGSKGYRRARYPMAPTPTAGLGIPRVARGSHLTRKRS